MLYMWCNCTRHGNPLLPGPACSHPALSLSPLSPLSLPRLRVSRTENLDRDRDGMVTAEELRAALVVAMKKEATHAGQEHAEESAAAIVDALDEDRDGLSTLPCGGCLVALMMEACPGLTQVALSVYVCARFVRPSPLQFRWCFCSSWRVSTRIRQQQRSLTVMRLVGASLECTFVQ